MNTLLSHIPVETPLGSYAALRLALAAACWLLAAGYSLLATRCLLRRRLRSSQVRRSHLSLISALGV